ncbi:MAG TPA: DUF4139 domain-containing protein [Syntrophorhabdaceae bacterium]|nr:DUF4139 domain-containing protein [Syntrophorhabdaceae bacterium]
MNYLTRALKGIFFIFLIVLVMEFYGYASASEKRDSGVEDQINLEVTVYNSNIGLVKDKRSLKLDKKGLVELRFMDVASKIIPESVSIKPITNPNNFFVLEQNYEYDLLNPMKLVDKYVGKQVKLLYKNPYTDKEQVVTATVLSNNDNNPVYKIGNEITFNYPGRILFPEVPADLISKPTLVWLLDNRVISKQELEVLYLTNGINWRADYVLVLNDKDTRSDLSGWVTIDNKSGTSYSNAVLKLVAGDVHRVKPKRIAMEADIAFAKSAAAPQFKEEAFFEYHIYTLDRRSTIKNNQTKQISLLSAQNIPIKKEFIYSGRDYYLLNLYREIIKTDKVGVYIEISNKKENNLGMPLPKGTIRVYKYDTQGSLQFVGEDSIEHTPKDEKINIKLGDAFDVVASRKQMSYEKISKNVIEVAFEISLRNHKKEDITVKVIEQMTGDWKILESSHEYQKQDAFRITFHVPVKKDKEEKLTYKARIKF